MYFTEDPVRLKTRGATGCVQPRLATHVTTEGACSIVAFSFHYMMRIRFSSAVWHDAHLVPVIRKLLATLQTNYISAGLLCGRGPGLTWSGSERETELPMPAAEEDIGPFEVRMHDLFSDFNLNLIETRRENCEPDHALLSTAWHRVNIRPSRVCAARTAPDR
jgi:hypothetical protein